MIGTLARWGRHKTRIPFGMFELAKSASEARADARLRNIYHRGQDLAWDGQAVLAALIERHGGIRLPEDKKRALSKVFEIILWGELAAWKISAELADEIEPLEAKMAATSQAHDEARHFYVMFDYLAELGYRPTQIDPYSQKVLDITLDTPSLAHKLLGMQLMIETIALTIFAEVRALRIEPVLTELLGYYEKDEARHVGLGTQFLPQLLRRMSRTEAIGTTLFQLRLIFWTLASLKAMQKDFEALGIETRGLMRRGRAKQLAALEEMWAGAGVKDPPFNDAVVRGLEAVKELVFPPPERRGNLLACVRAARFAFQNPDAELAQAQAESQARGDAPIEPSPKAAVS